MGSAFTPVYVRPIPLSTTTPTISTATSMDSIVQAISSACRDASGALENPAARLLVDFRDAFSFARSWFDAGCSAEVLLAAAMGVFASEPACVVTHETRRGGSVFRVSARRLAKGPPDRSHGSTVVPRPPAMPERDFLGFSFVSSECLRAYPAPATPAPNPIAQAQAACSFLSTWRTARRDPVALISALVLVARQNPRVAWFVDVDHLGDAFPVSEFVWANFWIPGASSPPAPTPAAPHHVYVPHVAVISPPASRVATASVAVPPPSRAEPELGATSSAPASKPAFEWVEGTWVPKPTAGASKEGARSEGSRKRRWIASIPLAGEASSTEHTATEPLFRSERSVSRVFGERIARGFYRRDDFCAGLMALLGDREELGDAAAVAEAIEYFEWRMRGAGVVTRAESETILECTGALKMATRRCPIDAEMIRGWRTMLSGKDGVAMGETWAARRSMTGYLFLSFGEILRGNAVPAPIGVTILKGLGMSLDYYRNACRIGVLFAKRPRLLCASQLQIGMLKALKHPLTAEVPDDEGLECLRLYCTIPTSPLDDVRVSESPSSSSPSSSVSPIPSDSDAPKPGSEAWDREVELLKAMATARTDLEASVHHVCLDAECRANPGMRAARLVATLVVSLDLESGLDPERKRRYLFCLESMARGRIPHDGTGGGDVEAAYRCFFSTALDTDRRSRDAARSGSASHEPRFLRRAACLLAHAPWILTSEDPAPLALRHCVETAESFDRLEALREEGRLLLLYPKLVAVPGDLRIDFLRRLDRATVGSVLEPGALDCLVAYACAFSRPPSQCIALHEPGATPDLATSPSDASRSDRQKATT